MQNYTFNITGTHCKSCKILVEDILSEQKSIHNPQVNLEKKTLSFESNIENQDALLAPLNTELLSFGYTLSPIL